MKIIFLDFDGVILTLRTCVANFGGWNRAQPDPVLVDVLKRACLAGVRIVVSSTWRTDEPTCKAKLDECGLLEYLHDDWRTVQLNITEAVGERPAEIQEWLNRHVVSDYRILDDDTWAFTSHQQERFLKCHEEDGASGRVLIALRDFAGLSKKDTAIIAADAGETARYAGTNE